MIAICKSVDIVYGASDVPLPVAGETVAVVRDAVSSMLNIPRDAKAFIKGKPVVEDYVLQEGDRLEFLKPYGFKGALDPEEMEEILKELRSGMKQLLGTSAEPNHQPVPPKQWFTPAEVAVMVERTEYTVQGWCRLQRIKARKRDVGRGAERAWEISAEEVNRYQNHGLLPRPRKY